MRILVVQETDWLDRNPILHHRMLEDLSARGHQILVIDFEILWAQRQHRGLRQLRRVKPDVVRWGGPAGVQLVRPGMLRLPLLDRVSWLIGNARELRRLEREWRPDVVVAYGISNAWLAQRWARRLGIPFVHHIMDALHTLAEPPALARLARLVEAAVLRRADHVLPVNNGLGDYVRDMGAPADRVTVLPMGVDHAPPAADGAAVREQLGIGPDAVVLLFMGWLYHFSGLLPLADAIERRAADLPGVVLLVVGDGDVLEELRARSARQGLTGRLLVTGRRPATEMAGLIAASDLCLLPADDNPTMRYIVPAKVIEYMQAGRPVLATPLPGLKAEFGDPPGLLWVRTPDELLDVVMGLGENDGARQARARELGRSVQALMAARPDWTAVTDRFELVLSSTRPGRPV